MECPHCQNEIPGKACTQCGAVVPAQGRFCMDCGTELEIEQEKSTTRADDDFDLENRVLCPDGTCTGIMVDGKCSECGRSKAEIEKQES